MFNTSTNLNYKKVEVYPEMVAITLNFNLFEEQSPSSSVYLSNMDLYNWIYKRVFIYLFIYSFIYLLITLFETNMNRKDNYF